MKTTLDLPVDLVRELKLLAVREGQKLKDLAAEVLRAGLAASKVSRARSSKLIVDTDRKTGLPMIRCTRKPTAAADLTPDRVSEVLLEQEAGWMRESN